MKSILREQWLSSLLVALITAALGAVLILRPNGSVTVMCYFLGGALLLSGVLYVASWFLGKSKQGASALLLIPGVVLAGLGVWLMLSAESVITLIQYVFGAVLLLHGLLDLQATAALVKYKAQNWVLELLLALITLGLGVAILWNPFGSFTTLVRIIGIALVYDGCSDLWLIVRLALVAHAFHKAVESIQMQDNIVYEQDVVEVVEDQKDEK